MKSGVTVQYQTPSGFWLAETELDCIVSALKGDWKRKKGGWVGPALWYIIAGETREYVHDSQWKMA